MDGSKGPDMSNKFWNLFFLPRSFLRMSGKPGCLARIGVWRDECIALMYVRTYQLKSLYGPRQSAFRNGTSAEALDAHEAEAHLQRRRHSSREESSLTAVASAQKQGIQGSSLAIGHACVAILGWIPQAWEIIAWAETCHWSKRGPRELFGPAGDHEAALEEPLPSWTGQQVRRGEILYMFLGQQTHHNCVSPCTWDHCTAAISWLHDAFKPSFW